MAEWIHYDREYVGLVTIDLEEIDMKRKSLGGIKNQSELLYNQLSYRLRMLHNEIETNELMLAEIIKSSEAKNRGTDKNSMHISVCSVFLLREFFCLILKEISLKKARKTLLVKKKVNYNLDTNYL